MLTRRFGALVAALLLALGMTACAGDDAATEDGGTTNGDAVEDGTGTGEGDTMDGTGTGNGLGS